jgi:hypothetical protein
MDFKELEYFFSICLRKVSSCAIAGGRYAVHRLNSWKPPDIVPVG